MPMTDVISYRTDKLEELNKLAKERNVSLSELSSNIIDYYLEFYELRKNLEMFKDSSEMLSLCFSLLDESDLEKTSDLLGKGITRYIKMVTSDFSLGNILKIYENWYKFNNFKVAIFDEADYTKIVCGNPMSKNWNKHAAMGTVNSMKDFGFDVITDTPEKGLLTYKISKQKSP